MAKQTVSARIGEIVEKEAKKYAKKRNISFSKLVEISLIHEMNKKDNSNGTLTVLKELEEFINNKKHDLAPVEVEPVNLYNDNIDSHVDEVVNLHDERGFVTEWVMETHAKACGISFEEFRKYMFDKGYDINIRNVTKK